MSKLVAIVALLASLACGGGATGPGEPTYPEIAGTYDFSTGAGFSGMFTLTDDSRETPGFTGTFSLAFVDNSGVNQGNASGPVLNGVVTSAGGIEMDFPDASMHITGSVAGRSITGTWSLTDEGVQFTGAITATRR